MPRDIRTRRPARAASHSASDDRATLAQPPLASLLAHTGRPTDLLPHLHQHALDVTGGVCSLLFQMNPRNGLLQATSGFALDALRTDPLMPEPAEADCIAGAFTRR